MTLQLFAKRYLPYFRRYRFAYTAAFLLLAVMSGLSLLPPLLIRAVVDRAIAGHNAALLWHLSEVLVLLILVLGLCRGCMDYLHEWAGNRVIASLRNDLLERLLSQDMHFYTDTRVGELLGRLRTDTTRLYGTVMSTLLALCSDLAQAVGISILLFSMNHSMALVAIAFVAPLIAITYMRRNRLQVLAMEFRDKDVSLLDFAQELFTNISLIKLLSGEQYVRDRHYNLNADLVDSGMANVRYKFVTIYLIGICSTLPSIVVLCLGAHAVIRGSMSVGGLIAFYLFVTRLYGPIQSLASRAVDISSGLASAIRIEEFLTLPPKELWSQPQPRDSQPIRGSVEFRDVVFTYPTRTEPSLDSVSFVVRSGERIAIIGESGAGKSTLVHLMTRLHLPSSGKVLVGAYDVAGHHLPSLRRSVGVVSQDITLFNDSIEANIRFGDLNTSSKDVLDAVRVSGLDQLIATLPQGLQTMVGPRGLALSGGQKQRLALARMLLRRPSIWVLDEPTSSLDALSALQIFERLLEVAAGSTTIVVTHDHSHLSKFDRILLLERGRVLTFCSPDEYRTRAVLQPIRSFAASAGISEILPA